MKHLSSIIRKFDIYLFVLIIVFLGFMVIAFGCNLLAQFDVACSDSTILMFSIMGLFTISLAGFAQIYRKEAPGLHPDYPIKGKLAVVIGWIWVLFCWAGIIYAFYLIIVK